MEAKSWTQFQKSLKTDGDCELWVGAGFGPEGYGLWKSGETKLLAHRAAFIHYAGYIPKNPVLQSCNNKRCCAEAHLRESPTMPRV